ncbi:MAG: hypothetical protein Q9182_000303 [Xanthomendoza sp. 2 TL-2023]
MRFSGSLALSTILLSGVSTVLSQSNPLNGPAALPPSTGQVLNIQSPPQTDHVCNGHNVKVHDIIAALARGDSLDIPAKKGAKGYPHPYENHEQISFPNCIGFDLLEYPVLRHGTNPWDPKTQKALPKRGEPDRVIFGRPKDTTPPTFCGVITHNRDFDPCTSA